MGSVESHLVFLAEERGGSEYAESWIQKLENAKKLPDREKISKTKRFVTGVPREEQWVRIQFSEQMSEKRLERLAQEQKLSFEIEEEFILVYGNEVDLKRFLTSLKQFQQSIRKQDL